MILPVALALACLSLPPAADHVLARDLAPAFPPLAAVAPDTEIALAPTPGVPRVFRALDWRLLAARFHLDTSALDTRAAEPVCVERPLAPLDVPRLLRAMRKCLPEARIEILEFSRQPAPEGEIQFPVGGLHAAPGNPLKPALWNGAVIYGGNRRFAIWASVAVHVSVPRVLAVADLWPGRPITAAQLVAEVREELPSTAPFAETVEQIAGRWPRTAIRAGSPIRTDQLEQPKDVMRGATVHVEVRNGAALLQFDAVAEASGFVGEIVPILNPASKKRFRGRVEAPGMVLVDAAPISSGGTR